MTKTKPPLTMLVLAAGVPDSAPRALTADEVELLAAHIGMTPWARSFLMDTARQYVDRWPVKSVSSLRLVKVGGAR